MAVAAEVSSADSFAISIAPLSLAKVYELAETPANGALVVMSGTVRDNTEGRAVAYLDYQAYEPMARVVFQQIAQRMRERWTDINRVVIHHRIGRLRVGEISVLVAVGCPHRVEAFTACQYAIDTLKHNAPIWKKEFFLGPDGTESGEWTQGCRVSDLGGSAAGTYS
ncbi:molybdopterin converting factor, large subunit [Rubidibacter lacunae KORDI 51-2]|uniref:Molybdopterin converting factor, large subunit n=1 Tax=Rubidibacter lacunae KORDI 51-2 TaxID=582515 RepID=U5DHZ0_9CHRO|nr:molybdenum cofactor biosynthesis protein MoaE [Rubidibacter lacunae]ERN41281.1 molybdopterin converting factor, large subunit [Rubidibacter lacunae KORDI 51-2]